MRFCLDFELRIQNDYVIDDLFYKVLICTKEINVSCLHTTYTLGWHVFNRKLREKSYQELFSLVLNSFQTEVTN
jgi:hypothetical protein